MTARHMTTRLGGLLALAALALLVAAALLSLSQPARAQTTPRIATPTTTLSDPVGSTTVGSYFYVEARVQVGTQLECPHRTDGVCEDEDADPSVAADADANERFARWVVPVYADNATVTWTVGLTDGADEATRAACAISPCIVALGNDNDFRSTTTGPNGRTWAVFRVLAGGSVKITASATLSTHQEPAVDSTTVEVGQSISSSPPEPGEILLAAPVEQRRNGDRFTVQAFVTDANGAAVNEAAVRWEAIGFENTGSNPASLETAIWQASSAERITTDGLAEATFARLPGNGNNNVLVIASAGNASASVLLKTGLTAARDTDTAALQLARATGQERWQLLDPDDSTTITLNAELTDPDGDPVPDGRRVYWQEGGIPNTAGDTVLSKFGDSPVTYSTTTTLGGGDPAGKAAYQFNVDAAGRGYVIVRNGNSYSRTVFIPFPPPGRLFTQTSWSPAEYPVDIAWFNVGEYVAPPEGLDFSLRMADDSDNVIAAGSTARIEGVLTWSGQGGFDQILHVTGGRLRIAGNYEWEDSRRNTFTNVPGSTLRSRGALLREYLLPRGFVGASAGDWTTGGECVGSSDGDRWTCVADLGNSEIVIPPGSPSGTFALSGTLTVNGREITSSTASLIEVVAPGEFDEVAEVQLDFAERSSGLPWPSRIAAGQSTRLRLKSLTERGGASPAGSITTVIITTNAGSLSTDIGGGCSGGGGLTCEIRGSALNADNADKIDITLTHPGPGKSGTARVTATVVTLDEEFIPPSRSVTFLGDATAIAISEPATGLLNQATSGDNRDVLTLTVSAVDSAGNSATVPYRNPRAAIKGPDSKTVTRGISVVWTEDSDDDDATHDRFTLNSANAVQATITATADSSAPLKTGDYTIELRTANHNAEQTFSVVGGVNSIVIATPESVPQRGQLVLSATVRDAAGAAVSDGTSIDWSTSSSSLKTALVTLTESSATSDGEASARFVVVGSGTSVVTASADGVSDVELVTVPEDDSAEAAAPAPDFSGDISSTDAGTFTVWFGEDMLASQILEGLNGTTSMRIWSNTRWIFYGANGDRLIPGSTDILVTTGTVLWLND